jgi:hypothetical protein
MCLRLWPGRRDAGRGQWYQQRRDRAAHPQYGCRPRAPGVSHERGLPGDTDTAMLRGEATSEAQLRDMAAIISPKRRLLHKFCRPCETGFHGNVDQTDQPELRGGPSTNGMAAILDNTLPTLRPLRPRRPSRTWGRLRGSVANGRSEHATPIDMTASIPPTNRIAAAETFRPSAATGLSGSCA